jgi:hypothetical protein
VTAIVTTHLGRRVTGEIRCWHGNRVVEVETPDGAREFGCLITDADLATDTDLRRASTADGSQ